MPSAVSLAGGSTAVAMVTSGSGSIGSSGSAATAGPGSVAPGSSIPSRSFVRACQKAKRVRFFRNGDAYFKGLWYAISSERFRSFESLMEELTRSLDDLTSLPHGVRAIFTLDGTSKLCSLEDFGDGESYVCSSNDSYKKIDYLNAREPIWSYGTPKHSSIAINPGNRMIWYRRMSPACGMDASGGGNESTSTEPNDFVRPKIITIIRNGVKPRKVVRLLLNKRTAHSFEQVLRDITEAVRLDSGAVKKLFSLQGRQISSLEDFFKEDDIFIAFGPERLCVDDFFLGTEEYKFLCSPRLRPSSLVIGPHPAKSPKLSRRFLHQQGLLQQNGQSSDGVPFRSSPVLRRRFLNQKNQKLKLIKKPVFSLTKQALPDQPSVSGSNDSTPEEDISTPDAELPACSRTSCSELPVSGLELNGHVTDSQPESGSRLARSSRENVILSNGYIPVGTIDDRDTCSTTIARPTDVAPALSHNATSQNATSSKDSSSCSITGENRVVTSGHHSLHASSRKVDDDCHQAVNSVCVDETGDAIGPPPGFEDINRLSTDVSHISVPSEYSHDPAQPFSRTVLSDAEFHDDVDNLSAIQHSDSQLDANLLRLQTSQAPPVHQMTVSLTAQHPESTCKGDDNPQEIPPELKEIKSSSLALRATGLSSLPTSSQSGDVQLPYDSCAKLPIDSSSFCQSSPMALGGSIASPTEKNAVDDHSHQAFDSLHGNSRTVQPELFRGGNAEVINNSEHLSRDYKTANLAAYAEDQHNLNAHPHKLGHHSLEHRPRDVVYAQDHQQPGTSTSTDIDQRNFSPPPGFELGSSAAFYDPSAVGGENEPDYDDMDSEAPPSVHLSEHPPVVEERYEFGRLVGDGNFANVFECFDRHRKMMVALKVIDKAKCVGKFQEEMVESEVQLLRRIRHPHIVELIDDHDSEHNMYLAMELVVGGDLFDALVSVRHYSEPEAANLLQNLISALDFLHSMDVVHRDVKPENLLIYGSSGNKCLKLADFGLATEVTESLYTVCGTPTYVAPEILAETGYGLKVDIWAAGVIMYIMLCGFPPFVSLSNSQEELFDLILAGQFSFPSPYWDHISSSAKGLIQGMLQLDSEDRVTASEVASHPWLTRESERYGEDNRAQWDLGAGEMQYSDNYAEHAEFYFTRRRSMDELSQATTVLTGTHCGDFDALFGDFGASSATSDRFGKSEARTDGEVSNRSFAEPGGTGRHAADSAGGAVGAGNRQHSRMLSDFDDDFNEMPGSDSAHGGILVEENVCSVDCNPDTSGNSSMKHPGAVECQEFSPTCDDVPPGFEFVTETAQGSTTSSVVEQVKGNGLKYSNSVIDITCRENNEKVDSPASVNGSHEVIRQYAMIGDVINGINGSHLDDVGYFESNVIPNDVSSAKESRELPALHRGNSTLSNDCELAFTSPAVAKVFHSQVIADDTKIIDWTPASVKPLAGNRSYTASRDCSSSSGMNSLTASTSEPIQTNDKLSGKRHSSRTDRRGVANKKTTKKKITASVPTIAKSSSVDSPRDQDESFRSDSPSSVCEAEDPMVTSLLSDNGGEYLMTSSIDNVTLSIQEMTSSINTDFMMTSLTESNMSGGEAGDERVEQCSVSST